jgi:hypothetical protein
MSVIAYSVRVNAYAFWLAGEFPSFSLSLAHADYPVRAEIGAARLSRLKVFFRWLLFIPAAIVSGITQNGLLVLSPIIWLITLVRGRTPQPIFSAAAAVIRYQARYNAYMSLVTDMYPRRLFGDGASDWVGGSRSEDDEERRRELRLPLSAGAHRLMVLIIVLGIAGWIGNIVLRGELRPHPNYALVAAENRLEHASQTYINSVTGCGSATALICHDSGDRAWGEAFDRFASDLSRVSFSGSEAAQESALVHDARVIGRALLAASKSQTLTDHTKAFVRVQLLLPIFEADARTLLGRGL